MTLADLRKFAIRSRTNIRFRARQGRDCVVTERGIARIPGLETVPDFNLEDELAQAGEFVLDSAAGQTRTVPRQELERMTGGSVTAAAADETE